MIFGKPKAILYLARAGASLYWGNCQNPFTIPFGELVRDLEVESPLKLSEQFKKNLATNKIGPFKVLIVLSEQVYFSKIIKGEAATQQPAIQGFLDEVPFKPDDIAKITLKTNLGLQVFAANKKLFIPIINGLHELKWQILAVCPIAIFSPFGIKPKQVGETDLLAPQEAKIILAKSQPAERTNFLASEDLPIVQTDKSTPKTNHKKKLLIISVVGVIIVLTVVLVLTGKINPNRFLSKDAGQPKTEESPPSASQQPVQTPPTETPQSTESSVPLVDKETLSIQILNGTGIAGQASTVKDQLTQVGFKSFTLGNAQNTANIEAAVAFFQNVPAQIQQEIIAELGKIFVGVA
ncbi:MAG: LytR C-terminal domain-containing protein, partial [Candidatus Blackburnbacteria bacterium]|nr:LytR C-terminal domain-containing protein [Candidatus Blackburnbacteria bacterium]